jgi:hypothetical protein
MALDPEELVTLTNHGTMKLCSAVARAMMLLPKERRRATIVRKGEPAMLNFEQIKDLASQWELQLVPKSDFQLPITHYALSGDVSIAYQTMATVPLTSF